MVCYGYIGIGVDIFISPFLTINVGKEVKVFVLCVEIQSGQSMKYRGQTTIKLLGKGEIN